MDGHGKSMGFFVERVTNTLCWQSTNGLMAAIIKSQQKGEKLCRRKFACENDFAEQ